MEIFTYKDYLNYARFLETKKEQKSDSQLQENSETYHIENKQVHHEHDKIFRKILDDKKEVANFINKTLELEVRIIPEQLEKYNSSFVTLDFKNQECDIIYKLKEQNIFFLIEHQTKVDYTMPLRILEYENQIMKSAIDKRRLGEKSYRLPKVISIVLYSGRKKWDAKDYIQKVQEELKGYRSLEFAKYNVVDINNYTEEELLQEESFLSKAMLIEKARYSGNLAIDLERIVQEINSKKRVYTKEQKELLIVIIKMVLSTKLEEEEIDKLIKQLKEGEKNMLAVLEMLEEENKRIFRDGKRAGEKQGIKKAQRETAKKLLQEGISVQIVRKVTGLSEKELSKLIK